MNIKKIAACVLLVVYCLTAALSAGASEATGTEDNPPFAGTRYVEYIFDTSDIDNYINGGRSVFELLLRRSISEHAYYSIKTIGRDINVKVGFDFSSYDEYIRIMSEFLMQQPSCLYNYSNGEITFIEGFSAIDMFSFFESELNTSGALWDMSFNDMYDISSNVLVLNSETYTGDQRLEVRSADNLFTVDELSVNTSVNEDGTLSRTLTVYFSDPSLSDTIVSSFEEAADNPAVTSTDYYYSSVQIEINSLTASELASATSEALGVAVYMSEQEKYVSDTCVGVSRTEYFDIESLLNDPSSGFSYYSDIPYCATNVRSVNDSTYINDGSVYSNNSGYIAYYYERGFSFSSIKIETDFSSLFGKKSRTVTVYAPRDIARSYHKIITDEFKKLLDRGMSLDVYDDGIYRCYEFSFSSWFEEDIAEFTGLIFDDYYYDRSRSIWPYGYCMWYEDFNTDNLIEGSVPVPQITFIQKYPAASSFICVDLKSHGDSEYIPTESTVNTAVSSSISIEYKVFNLLSLIIILALVGSAAAIAPFAYKKLSPPILAFVRSLNETSCPHCKAVINRKSTECPVCGAKLITQPAPEAQPQKSNAGICANCGAKLIDGKPFCIQCGTKHNDTPTVPVSEQPQARTCKNCGAKLVDGKPFCIQCGTRHQP